ncbi:conserved hypothetical protein [Neospora caninum Liverpool]|uniref:Serine/threonine-protein phosphatase 4 regulatory subunit 3-like central domain-containing protein n=1 Tax=Neospora caninum (strain Liverpool) TaxID=572307 RepID=F0VIY4_NEOCL|nr:conserved hypothetical protein [Neospora caninum Liverpool]CBZ53695.1 conserved hypothetical protein [Neospora caninum Liverpool]|eukprot:XP_003883727.1 conserved hypothetical protein [Neospora caninum Liverpool]
MGRTGDAEGSPDAPLSSAGLAGVSREAPGRAPRESRREKVEREHGAASGATPTDDACIEAGNGEENGDPEAGTGRESAEAAREHEGPFAAETEEDVDMEEPLPAATGDGGDGNAHFPQEEAGASPGRFASTGESGTPSVSVPSPLSGFSGGDSGGCSAAFALSSEVAPSARCRAPEKGDAPASEPGMEAETGEFSRLFHAEPGPSSAPTLADPGVSTGSSGGEASVAPSCSDFSAAGASSAPEALAEASASPASSVSSPDVSPADSPPPQTSSPAASPAFPSASAGRPLSRAAARAGVNMTDALPPGLRPDILLHSPPEVVRQYVAEHFAHLHFSEKKALLAGGEDSGDSSEESEEEKEDCGDRDKEGVSKREVAGRRDGEEEAEGSSSEGGNLRGPAANEGESDAVAQATASGETCGEGEDAVFGGEKAAKLREMAMKAKQSARGSSSLRGEGKKRRKLETDSEEAPRLHPVNSLNLSCRRVKLYEVDDTGRWIDKGTGHFYVTEGSGTAAGDGGAREEELSRLYLERDGGEGRRDEDDETGMARLIVEDEENGKVYVDTAIGNNYAYQHQKDSIITWQEGRTGDVYRALSFQHPHGCFACWSYLTLKAPDRCAGGTEEEEEEEEGDDRPLSAAEDEERECGRRQGALGRFRRSEEGRDERDEDEDEAGVDPLVGLDGADSIPHHILETPNEDNLHMLMTRMEFDLPHPQTGELVLLDVLGRHWLYLLFAFMRKCIAADKIEQLKQIAFIIRKMLVFWSGHIDALEVLLSDEFWPDVLKSLEYDQDLLHQGMEMRHSEFFSQRAQFHNVVQLEDPVFTSHVHLHYRLMYLKDVAITRYLDEAAINRLQSVLACNIQEVLRLLLRDCPSPPACPSSPSSFSSYSSHSLTGAPSGETLNSSCFAVLRERLSEDFMAALFLRELLQNLSKLLQQQMLEKHSIFTQIKQHMIVLELRGILDGTSAAVANWNQVFLPLNKKAEEVSAVERLERSVDEKVGVIHRLAEATQQIENVGKIVENGSSFDVGILAKPGDRRRTHTHTHTCALRSMRSLAVAFTTAGWGASTI